MRMFVRTLSGIALVALTLLAQPRRRETPAEGGSIETGLRDGHWFAAVRVASPGAAALQVLIEEMALPQGATLTLYEVDVLGARASAAATYTGAGPVPGSFWSGPVKGDAAILEVLYDEAVAAGLPLHIADVRGLDAAEWASRPEAVNTVPEASGLPYQVIDDIAVVEGDIMLGPVEEIEKNGGRAAMGITSTSYRWTGGVIPYTIDTAMPDQQRITDAVAHWNQQLAGTIQLVPRTNQSLYVRFAVAASASTCSSYIGRIGMAGQAINIGAYCSKGNVIHEIGHAVGLYHEHTREDRNANVQIMFENIDSAAVSNFNQAVSSSDDLGAYDFGSIMHYPATAFSINGNPTIVTIPPGIPIGQRSGLSAGDIAGVRTMYPTAPAPPSTVTITFASNPVGRTLMIDGSSVVTPATRSWTVGSLHTVSTASETIGNTRYNFTSWSDGGAASHSITTPSAAQTYTANFALQHRITAVSGTPSLGTVSLSPASTDSFYNQGTSVTVTATSLGSACLGSWSGVTAPPSSPLQLSASQPYSLTGNFQSGAVTVSAESVIAPWIGGTFRINVTANTGCSWTASSTANWISFSTRSGTGSGTVTFSVPQRNAANPRSATITIGNTSVFVVQTRRY